MLLAGPEKSAWRCIKECTAAVYNQLTITVVINLSCLLMLKALKFGKIGKSFSFLPCCWFSVLPLVLPAWLFRYVGGGSSCAGREYELPGRQTLFCLEDCWQRGEDGWGQTGKKWDWQLQPAFIHPFIHPSIHPALHISNAPFMPLYFQLKRDYEGTWGYWSIKLSFRYIIWPLPK